MEGHGWKVRFCWVKAHAQILGNKLADTLTKEAAMTADTIESYHKVSRSVVKSDLNAISVVKWQREWDNTTKGQITKAYFPTVRLNTNVNPTQKFTTKVTGHGNIRSYLY